MALNEEQMIASEEYVAASWRCASLGGKCAHWLMLSAPEQSNALLLDCLQANAAAKRDEAPVRV